MGSAPEACISRLRCFGGLSLVGTSRVLSGAALQRRPLALLAVLAVAGERGVSRDRLQALLWPESDTERARRVLAQTLYALRRDLGDAGAVLGTSDLRLNPELVHADVTEFERAIAAGEDERAVLLYTGPFLDGVHLADAPEFEQWAEGERDRLARRAREVLERLAKAAESRGDWEVAAGWWRRLAALDPLSGRIASRLMQALATSGDVSAALCHARIHETLMREELGAPPDASVAALAARLRTPPTSSPAIPERSSVPSSAPSPGTVSTTARSAASTERTPVTPARAAGDEVPVSNASRAPAIESSSAVQAVSPSSGDPRAAEQDLERDAAPPALPPSNDHPDGHGTERAERRAGALGGRNRWLVPLGVTGAALVVASLVWTTREGRDAPPDPALIVVAPFDVADPGLQLWREGMVDVLSRNLDGAGPLRTVSPSVVVREWAGRADRETVAAFARRLGAGSAVYGGLVRAGPDSVLATLALLDLASGRLVVEVRRRDALARMDRLTDSLTLALVRGLATRVSLGAARLSSLAAGTSVEALRSFLRAEQFYRRATWDSAVAHYTRALDADPSFALAHRRLGLVLGWQGLVTDSMAEAHLLHAGALNRGLGHRDSLLVAADSLAAAANAAATAIEQWPFARRLFSTLGEAVRAYPTDPEVWYAMGEARYHFGAGPVLGIGSSRREILDAFDRAIAADSSFGPAYAHTAQLALDLGGPALALRYVKRYQAAAPSDAASSGAHLIEALITPPGIASPSVRRVVDTLAPGPLYSVRTTVRRWPDSAETAVQLARLLADDRRASRHPPYRDSTMRARLLAEQLAYRGHVREARRVIGDQDAGIAVELAYLGGAPPDSIAARIARLVASGSRNASQALAWWSERRDTSALRTYTTTARARLAGTQVPARLAAVYDTGAAAAHLALARGDSADAIARFTALPDTLCPRCYPDRLVRSRLPDDRRVMGRVPAGG